jgi:hypothetical protein
LDGRKERAELIEDQLREKDKKCSGIGPWWHGKGGEICFFPQSRSDLDCGSDLIPCCKVSPPPPLPDHPVIDWGVRIGDVKLVGNCTLLPIIIPSPML